MGHNRFLTAVLSSLFPLFAIGTAPVLCQIPSQLAEDFVAGSVPSPEEVAEIEKAMAVKPNDPRLTRKLAKAYFFQFFGEGDLSAVSRSEKTFEKVFAIKKDDAESLVYLGALHILKGRRLEKNDPAKQKASYDRGFELVKLAEKAGPRHGAVLSIASASYLWLPDSYGMAPYVVGMLEGMRKGMGPMFQKFSHHGQQRLLLTLGQAYARTGQNEKARIVFDEGLKVSDRTLEAGLLRAELAKLKN